MRNHVLLRNDFFQPSEPLMMPFFHSCLQLVRKRQLSHYCSVTESTIDPMMHRLSNLNMFKEWRRGNPKMFIQSPRLEMLS